MFVSWFFGILLIHNLGFSVFLELWMQAKILLVTILTYYHFTLGKFLSDFAYDNNKKTSKFLSFGNDYKTRGILI